MQLVVIDYNIVRQDNEPGPPSRFNTSFCPAEKLPKPVERPLEAPYAFSKWLPHIVRSRKLAESDVQVVQLTQQQARLLIESSAISIITGAMSRVHQEDLEDLMFSVFSTLRNPPEEQGLFMRLDGCSPKDATCRLHNGSKPQSLILSTKDIIMRLCSSQRATNTLTKSLEDKLIYIPIFFLPFNIRMNSAREYRVFCAPSSGRITAISQYQWHKPWKFSTNSTKDVERESMQIIADHITIGAQSLQQDIIAGLHPDRAEEHRILLNQGFSFDLFYDEDTGDIQLVELNVFGARSGLGACLFNWVDDFDLLYGNGAEEAEFRVTF